jgi:iron(III) transport system substrate-binding protein
MLADRKIARVAVIAALLCSLAACSRDARTPVVVYSPHGQAQLAAFEKRFEEAYPQYDLQPVDQPSQNIPDRLRAERASPQCDVWWGASSITFAQAAEEGLLEPYTPAWAEAIAPDSRDPQNRWMGVYETPEVIVYNSETVPEAEAPKDWDELLDPRWRGKILIRDPIPSDTMRTIFGAMILRKWDESNGPGAGYDWLRRLAENTKDYATSWEGMLTSLNRQEASITVWNMPDIRRAVDERGYKLGYVFPSSGTPTVIDCIALVKGAPHPEGARAFYEFANTPESLAYAAEGFYRIPTRNDLDRATLPAWIRALNYKRMVLDWDRFRAESKVWMTLWSAEIKNARPAA